MSKFYESPEFFALQKEWQEKLAKTGFCDAEDKKGNLKQPDRRTIAFDNQIAIRDFFYKLDSYLTHNTDIKPKQRKILDLYSQGVPITGKNGILQRVGLSPNSDRYCRRIISKYKQLVLRIK